MPVTQDHKSERDRILIEFEDYDLGDEADVLGFENEDGFVSYTLKLPAKLELCSRCRGHGTHVNPSIDGNGITESEFAEWHQDEVEGYFSGAYDVCCYDCSGDKTEKVIDTDAVDRMIAVEKDAGSKSLTEFWLKQYDDYCEESAYMNSVQAAEMAFGC